MFKNVNDVAAYYKVSIQTIRRWFDKNNKTYKHGFEKRRRKDVEKLER
jgi:transposase